MKVVLSEVFIWISVYIKYRIRSLILSCSQLETGSAAKNGSGAEERQVQMGRNPNTNEEREIQRISTMHISRGAGSAEENVPAQPHSYPEFCYNFHEFLIPIIYKDFKNFTILCLGCFVE